jgi:hypothetical protein
VLPGINDTERKCPLTYNHNYVHNRLVTAIIDFCFTEDHAGIADHVTGNSKAFFTIPENSVSIRNKPLLWVSLGNKKKYQMLNPMLFKSESYG